MARQRDSFSTAQCFDFTTPTEASKRGVKGCNAPFRVERLERGLWQPDARDPIPP